MEFLTDYGMFLAKFMTIIITLSIIAGIIMILVIRSKAGGEGHFDITNLNQKYENMNLFLQSQILPKSEVKKLFKETKSKRKKKDRKEDSGGDQKNIYVMDFKGDIKATEVASLREKITAILTIAKPSDEIVVLLESAGGTVHGYGLCASQLKRIRDRGINLTVVVDKVAASGGYMMACVANKIIAAPFAIIGSVGVLAQLPNFNRLLKKHNIDFEEITAGEYKRTLTLFGENTDKDRAKLKEELEQTHQLFKEFIKANRDQVDIDKVATGEHWYGKKALELNLVDELMTSDDYLYSSSQTANLYQIDYIRKKPFSEKIFSIGTRLLDHLDSSA